jgi:hypothetical protein
MVVNKLVKIWEEKNIKATFFLVRNKTGEKVYGGNKIEHILFEAF